MSRNTIPSAGRWKVSTIAALLLFLFIAACSDDDPVVPDPVVPSLDAAGTVGPAGGILESDDGRLKLTVPAGALATGTNITITEVTADDIAATGAGLDVIYALTIDPPELEFSTPATLELHYDFSAKMRPENFHGVSVPVAIITARDIEGDAIRGIPEQLLSLRRSPGSTVVHQMDINGGTVVATGQLEYLRNINQDLEPLVASGLDVSGLLHVNAPFAAHAAVKLNKILELDSGISYVAEPLSDLTTETSDGAAFTYESSDEPDDTTRYDFGTEYSASSTGKTFANFGVFYRAQLDVAAAFPNSLDRPVVMGGIGFEHQFESLSLQIEEAQGTGAEIAPGTYRLAVGLEGGFLVRGVVGFPYDNTLAVSGANGTTLYSLDEADNAAEAYTGFQGPDQETWGSALITAAFKAVDLGSLAFLQFGPSGARLTSWLPDDEEFGWSQLLEFQTAVTDGQPFGGDSHSGGFVYVASAFDRVSLVEFNTDTGFYDIGQTLNQFPQAPGPPFTAAVRRGAGTLVVTSGSPGKIYHHDMVDLLAPAVAVGDAGNSPRRIRTAGDLAFISNFESDDLTVLTWSPSGAVAVVGQIPVGDGPVGIDALVLSGGNIAVVSTGFNDDTYTLTVVTPTGGVVSNTTTNLPARATVPGHAFWLRGEAAHFGVTCNGSGDLVVVDSLLD